MEEDGVFEYEVKTSESGHGPCGLETSETGQEGYGLEISETGQEEQRLETSEIGSTPSSPIQSDYVCLIFINI